MVSKISSQQVANLYRTPKRPEEQGILPEIREAERLFLDLYPLTQRGAISDKMGVHHPLIKLSENLYTAIKETGSTQFDQLWSNMEKRVNQKQILKTEGNTPAEKLRVIASFFYSAVDEIDKGENMRVLTEFYYNYKDAVNIMKERYKPCMNTSEQTSLKDILNIIDNRFKDVVSRFNKKIDAGKIQGEKIPISS